MRVMVRKQTSAPSMTTLMSAAHAAGFAMVHVDGTDYASASPGIDEPSVSSAGVANYVHGYVDVRRPPSHALVVSTAPVAGLSTTPGVVADWFRTFGMGLLGGRVATP
ncbi:MAG: hypothetical protein NW217_06125 [Hyphomicrobiaceae bacterium]|nr:hypothetical protein [Hyphomicrobiaceae bacterium]